MFSRNKKDDLEETRSLEDSGDTASFEPIDEDDEYTRGLRRRRKAAKKEYMRYGKGARDYKFKKLLAICISVILAVSLISGAVVYVSSLDRLIVNKGYNALASGDYDEAIAEFDRAIAQNGAGIEAYAGKALAQISGGYDPGASETINTMFTTCSGGAAAAEIPYSIGSYIGSDDNGADPSAQNAETGSTDTGGADVAGGSSGSNESGGSSGSNGLNSASGPSVTAGAASIASAEPTNQPKNEEMPKTGAGEILSYLFNWICRYNIANGCADQNEILMNTIEQNGLNAQYGIYSRPPQPTTDCPSGTYNKPVNVNLYSSGDGTICYIVGEGEFALKNLTIYEGTIYIKKNNSSTHIRAALYDGLYIPSDVLELNYTLERAPLSSPTYSHNSGSYTGGFYLTLSNPNDDGTIYYTTNGAEPMTDSNVYSGRIYIGEGSVTIKVKVIDSQNEVSSQTASLTYSVTKPKPTPTPKRSGRTCPVCGSNNTAFDSSIGAYKCYDCGNADTPDDPDDGSGCPRCGSTNITLIGNWNQTGNQIARCLNCDYKWDSGTKVSSTNGEPETKESSGGGEKCAACGSTDTFHDPNGWGIICRKCGHCEYYEGLDSSGSSSSGVGADARE